MQIDIDREACIGCNACVEDCPDLFSLDDDEKAVVSRAPGAEQEACAQNAAEDCPTDAIQLR